VRTWLGPVLLSALLLSACTSSGGGAGADDSAPAPTAVVPEAELFLGVRTGTVVVTSAGYGPLTVVDLDTGHARTFADLRGVPGDHEFTLVPLEDGVAFPGPGGPLVVPWTFYEPAHPLGEARWFLPGGEPDRVWLVRDDASGGPAEVELVDGDGHRHEAFGLPPDVFPIAAVGDQVVLQQHLDLPLALPGPTRALAMGDSVSVVAAGTQVLTLAPDGTTELLLTVEANDQPSGSLSPDERQLAIWIGTQAPDGTSVLEIVDLDTREARIVPVEGPGFGSVAWSHDGRWLLALVRGVGTYGETRVLAHDTHTGETVERTVPALQAGRLVAVPDDVEGPDLQVEQQVPMCPAWGGLDHNTNPLPDVTTDGPCRLVATAT
jgi:hypothetical protein